MRTHSGPHTDTSARTLPPSRWNIESTTVKMDVVDLKRMSSVARSSAKQLLLMLICVQLTSNFVHSSTGQLSPPKSNRPDQAEFRDPIVWDANSLYKHRNSERRKRSAGNSQTGPQHQPGQLVDACQSKMEILTPYYATNSKGKLRTIVNSELMQQAIQVETCVRSPTNSQVGAATGRCSAQVDCGCEQKYKWHRLLVLDPHESGAAKGLFMDWFLFPSNCVCRCSKSAQHSSRQFLRTITTSIKN